MKKQNVGDPAVLQPEDRELRALCRTALREKYGQAVAPEIRARMEEELERIAQNQTASMLLCAAFLAKECKKRGYVFSFRGCVGNSFAAFLTGISEVNPLPPHYYCPNCKCVQFVDRERYPSGFDLPGAFCSRCGGELRGDGHDLPHEFFPACQSGNPASIEFNLPVGARDRLCKLLQKSSDWDVEMIRKPWKARITAVRNPCSKPFEICLLAFPSFSNLTLWAKETHILPDAFRIADPSLLQLLPEQFPEDYECELPPEKRPDKRLAPKTFSDFVRVEGMLHGTGVWRGNGEHLADRVPARALIAHREDVMQTLQRYGFPGREAFEIADRCRTGKQPTNAQRSDMSEAGVPHWYMQSMEKIQYLFPRGHSVAVLIARLRLIWYRLHFPHQDVDAAAGTGYNTIACDIS